MPRKVNQSDISEPVNRMLWGRSAGRCQFNGCNKPLWKSSVTQEGVNIAERAHMWAASDGGSRGNEGIDPKVLNSLGNLLLFCKDCHKTIDNEKDGGRYTTELLQGWKREHEDRIELVTGIQPSKTSHIIVFGSPVGDHSSPLTYEATAHALFPEHYPAEDRAISLQMTGNAFRDKEEDYWSIEEANLRKRFERDLRPRVESGEIGHMSLFGFAPQPLLMLFGSLLTDIPFVQSRQLRREPQTWSWAKDSTDSEFTLKKPEDKTGTPALIVSLSATINQDRIKVVLGPETSIWTISTPNPNRDCIGSTKDLTAFRRLARKAIDEIKSVHGEATTLHVFPAMPISTAIDLGRIRMPKADLSWLIYDQIKDRGGFVEAIRIGS